MNDEDRKELEKKIWEFPITDSKIEKVERFDAVVFPEPNPLKLRVHNPGGYYKVTLLLRPSEQSHIRVAVGLPDPDIWNGKFLGIGNGGYAGSIAENALLGGLSRGYATATTDLGTTPDPDNCIGMEEIWEDFGHRATHLMTVVGKDLACRFYGRKPEYAYFTGGSTGGQQAFSEALRYPADYNGIVCLSPAFDRVRLHAWFLWNWRQVHGEGAAFTQEQAQKWKDCIVRVYGKQCGSNADDSFLAYPERISDNPIDYPDLQKDAEEIFTKAQRRALRRLYEGPKNADIGGAFAVGFLPGTEAESLSLAAISDKEMFAHEFFYPFRWIYGKDFDPMAFDFERDLPDAIAKLGPILDANSPALDAFKEAGGKLLVIGGSCDAIIPYTGFLDYYRRVIQAQGGLAETKGFFRFLLMPGFAHTIGGSGVQEVGVMGIEAVPRDARHDAVCAMEHWVENGIAPERLLGTHFAMGAQGLSFDYARPADVYPNVTEYAGGDPKEPESYRAVNRKKFLEEQ